MKLLRVTQAALPNLESVRFIIVESQEFGQPTDFIFHAVVGDDSAAFLCKQEGIREIKDTGRTVGLSQNLGGQGIYKVNSISPILSPDIPVRVQERLKRQPEAKISFQGKTWKAIILSMPIDVNVLAQLNISKDSPKPARSGRRKATKKTVDKKSTQTNNEE